MNHDFVIGRASVCRINSLLAVAPSPPGRRYAVANVRCVVADILGQTAKLNVAPQDLRQITTHLANGQVQLNERAIKRNSVTQSHFHGNYVIQQIGHA